MRAKGPSCILLGMYAEVHVPGHSPSTSTSWFSWLALLSWEPSEAGTTHPLREAVIRDQPLSSSHWFTAGKARDLRTSSGQARRVTRTNSRPGPPRPHTNHISSIPEQCTRSSRTRVPPQPLNDLDKWPACRPRIDRPPCLGANAQHECADANRPLPSVKPRRLRLAPELHQYPVAVIPYGIAFLVAPVTLAVVSKGLVVRCVVR